MRADPVTQAAPAGDVLSRRQAAEILGVTVATMNRWAIQSRGPRYSLTGKQRGRALYLTSDVVAWVEQQRVIRTALGGPGVRPCE